MSKSFIGRVLSEKTKEKISKKIKGKSNPSAKYIRTTEIKLKMINTRREKRKTEILQYDIQGNFIKLRESFYDIEKYWHILDCCKRKIKTSGGFVWRFKNEYGDNYPLKIEPTILRKRGFKHTEESKRKIGLGQIGRKHSEETNKKRIKSNLAKMDQARIKLSMKAKERWSDPIWKAEQLEKRKSKK